MTGAVVLPIREPVLLAKQPRLPLFMAGNTERAIRRTARWGDGWLPASLPLPQLAAGNARLRAYAEEAGRDPTQLSVATQLVVCLGRTQAEAEERFKASPVYEEWTTVGLSGVPLEGFLGANLIGTPEEFRSTVIKQFPEPSLVE